MSQSISPSTGKPYGLKQVCKQLGVARSNIYRSKSNSKSNVPKGKRGPKPKVSDEELLVRIREDIKASPFTGEGHRKVHARLRKQQVVAGRNRVLNIMEKNNLLSPHRSNYRAPNPHDGHIITNGPNIMWCSDGMKVQTVEDGWVWVFAVTEHWNVQCMGWHVCKIGDRFAALEPIRSAVRDEFGATCKGAASGLTIRIDNGTQYTSRYMLQQLDYYGIKVSFGLVRQPETNGVAERFNRTLKEQVVNGRVFQNIDELREAMKTFVETYNEKWLVAKLGHQSPLEARRNYSKLKKAA